MANIHGKEHPLKDIFSDQFAYSIPSFQRPYAWQNEHVDALITDLITFMQESESVKETPPYFLGSIVLIKKEGIPEAEVVDGQQRLTTLTILLAVLRESLEQKKRNDLTKFIYEEGNEIAGTPNRYRLTLRERDAEFFQKYIQHEGGLEKLKELNSNNLFDSQKNIKTNALLLLERVNELTEKDRFELAKMMILHCYLVEISTSDLDSAYNVFSILNDRGLNLSHADILKAQIIGKIPKGQRQKYTAKWEDAEELLGNSPFRQLFYFLVSIYDQDNFGYRNQKPLLPDFRKFVFPTAKDKYAPTKFIDEIFLPHTRALLIIKNTDYRVTKETKKINHILIWIKLLIRNQRVDSTGRFDPTGRIDPVEGDSIWMPPLLHYIALNLNNPKLLLHFLTELERLITITRLQPITVISHKELLDRVARLTRAIQMKEDLYSSNESPFYITETEKKKCIATLNSDMYHRSICLYILLKLDDEYSAANEPNYSYSFTTIEHVLPQNPKENSTWAKWYPDKIDRDKYTNILGNLVLLSKSKNSEAQNYDFTKKKQKYFISDKGTSSFALTTQVLQEQEWTTEVIERRQKMLVDKIINILRLS